MKSFQTMCSTSKPCFNSRFLPAVFLSVNRESHESSAVCLCISKHSANTNILYDFRIAHFTASLRGEITGGSVLMGSIPAPLPHGELEILCVDYWLGSTHTDIHAGAGLPLRFYKPHQFFIIGYPQGLLRTSAYAWQEKGPRSRILSPDTDVHPHSHMHDS